MTGIITQGARDFGNFQYVASYKVAYSNDGVQWTVYEEQGISKVGVLSGCNSWGTGGY